MASKKNRSRFKFFFLFLLLVAGGYFYWQYSRTQVLWDQSALSGQLEEQTDQVLTAFNIKDADVLKIDRQEKRSGWPLPLLWIQTEKTVRLPNQDVKPIVQRLNQAARSVRVDLISQNQMPGKVVLEYGRKQRILQKFIFLLPADVASKNKNLASVDSSFNTPCIAIVIDDIAGRPSDLAKLDAFFALPLPITYAVLPASNNTRRCVEKISQKGAEIILHQPMEAEKVAPSIHGPYALWTNMDTDSIEKLLQKNLQSVQLAIGVSNHMGSRFTSDPEALKRFFAAYKKLMGKTPLFFFDSATNFKDVSQSLAAAYKVPSLRNDIFLDNKDDLAAMKKQIDILAKIALKRGYASGIGHIQRRYMVQALQESVPELEKKGIRFVNLSEIVNRSAK